MAAGDLPDPLKPSWPKSGSAPVSVSSGISFSGSHESPLYARDMARQVMSALDSLCRLVADNLDRIRKTEEAIDKLKREISQLEWDKLIKLNEFRRGEFCSGCDKTRSQILAKGEQFPHPGQQIVLPTKEQIEAKERELEAPVASRRKELPITTSVASSSLVSLRPVARGLIRMNRSHSRGILFPRLDLFFLLFLFVCEPTLYRNVDGIWLRVAPARVELQPPTMCGSSPAYFPVVAN